MKKHDQDFIKKQNKSWVLNIIKKESPISRADIAKLTNMSPTTISRIVNELCQQGFVQETELVTSGVGRKAVLLDICKDVIYTIGVELDKSVINIGIVNFTDELIATSLLDRNSNETYEETLRNVSRHVLEMIQQNGIPKERIIGLGVGLPGLIDHKNGEVILSAQLGWGKVPIAKTLKELTGFNVIIDNELKMKAYAEYLCGAAKGSEKTTLIGFGTGVGSALIINGEIYRGETNSAGEIGHTVVDPNGIVCECGKIGCLQTYIAESALLSESKKIKNMQNINELFESMRNGESWALNIIERAATYISITISNVLCLYNPDTIILSGSLVENYPEIQRLVDQKTHLYIWEPLKSTYKLAYSELKEQGVVIGAAIQAQTEFLESRLSRMGDELEV
ncbi:ROK family transcriptional regulator [Peribacillus loiseleuriae]|uniref:ROK family transcriptional regulator n=1 Tax=Peribacillus loiseleuriae TaxID=1679170 RepID=UPI003D02A7E3